MSLDLDQRHRAMLLEMGVHVWLPMTPVAEVPAAAPVGAIKYIAKDDSDTGATGATGATGEIVEKNLVSLRQIRAVPAPVLTTPPEAPSALPLPAVAAPARATTSATSTASASGVAVSWRLGESCVLYADAAHAEGARWLVLAETPAAALQANPVFNPFHGDAGKLLDNMLRAARLHQAGMVLLAPLTRQAAAAGEGHDFSATLQALITSTQPDVVLVMGRLASLALLHSSEAFGRLRGQVHTLHAAKTVVTYDATYLLRNQADKARAWEDLCLAMNLVDKAK